MIYCFELNEEVKDTIIRLSVSSSILEGKIVVRTDDLYIINLLSLISNKYIMTKIHELEYIFNATGLGSNDSLEDYIEENIDEENILSCEWMNIATIRDMSVIEEMNYIGDNRLYVLIEPSSTGMITEIYVDLDIVFDDFRNIPPMHNIRKENPVFPIILKSLLLNSVKSKISRRNWSDW